MGALVHKDIQVKEEGDNPIRQLIRELNRQLRTIARIVTVNFRSPIAINAGIHQSATVWNPREPFEILSFDVYCETSGFTINAINDSTGAIPVAGLPGTIAVLAATHTNIECTPRYAVNAGQSVYFGFSVPPTTEDVVISINVRRLG